MNIPILQPAPVHWVCANGCKEQARTVSARIPMHACSEMAGLNAPLIRAGTKAKVEAVEREDYVGDEHVQLVNGRPVMSIVTTRDDGQDCTVLAPMAEAQGE